MTYESSIMALADPTRRAIFESLAQKPRSVAVLAGALPVSRPAVSQHLKVLSDAGLVVMKTAGTRHIYSVRAEGLSELRAYIDGLWGDVLAEFAKEINDRKGIES